MDRIIDIVSDGRHLSKDRGFMRVSERGAEASRIPLDQIAAVIVNAHGTTWTTSLLTELGNNCAPVVLCGPNHMPQSVLLPIKGHHSQGGRMRAQWEAKLPLLKQAWKRIVIAKIQSQAAALQAFGEINAPLHALTKTVASGDPANIEAQAARIYWPIMMGSEFRRDRSADGANALLNYGYTVLRAAAARAVVSSGLHPTIGIHHKNRGNAFALADDLMEPFRPLVDAAVRGMLTRGLETIDTEAKGILVSLIALDLPIEGSLTPVSVALKKLAVSLARSFERGSVELVLPEAPDPLTFAGLGR